VSGQGQMAMRVNKHTGFYGQGPGFPVASVHSPFSAPVGVESHMPSPSRHGFGLAGAVVWLQLLWNL
jgi:hypothetical protein